MHITLEQTADAAAIEKLLDTSFGPKRHTKTVYRLRKNVAPVADLCFVAMDQDENGDRRLVGTIRYWPVLLAGSVPALMLGPIAIDPAHRSSGLGSQMIRHSLAQAAALGHKVVILVGDAPYYVRFGFNHACVQGLSLPGPVDLARFQGLELVEGALAGVTGTVGRAVAPKASKPRTSTPARPGATVTALPLPPSALATTGTEAVAIRVHSPLVSGDGVVGRRRLRRAAR